MDWVKFFTREELVAGLEISNENLRLTLISQNKNKESIVATVLEEPLKEGIVIDGAVKNKEEFAKAVKKLVGKSKTKIRYAIISIPENKIFSKIFAFPKSIKETKLKETMELSIGFQLPIKLEEVYLDWEKIETPGRNEVLLAAVPKSIIGDYISALESTRLKIIAAEFHLLSIVRALPPSDTSVLLLLDRTEGMTIGVAKNRVLRFMHNISYGSTPKERLITELKRIINFYEGEHEPLSKIVVLKKETADLTNGTNGLPAEDASIIEPFASNNEIKKDVSKWLISAGAAIRGAMSRREDTLISLMPVGTEEAYEYQKATTFSNLVADIVAVTAVVFLSVFLGGWFLMLSIQQSLSDQYSLSSSLPVPRETVELEAEARHLNLLLSKAEEIVKATPMWDGVVAEIMAKTASGISVTNLSINSPDTPIIMQGIAQDRDTINSLRKTFEASDNFTEINIPLTTLEKKTDIPFSISFKLKNPQSVYLK